MELTLSTAKKAQEMTSWKKERLIQYAENLQLQQEQMWADFSSKDRPTAIHPIFQNDLIMDRITGYLKTEDLANCRLVSRQWNEIICEMLSKRRRMPLLIFANCRLVNRSWTQIMCRRLTRRTPVLISGPDCAEAPTIMKRETLFSLSFLNVRLDEPIIRRIALKFQSTLYELSLFAVQVSGFPDDSVCDLLRYLPNVQTLRLWRASFSDTLKHPRMVNKYMTWPRSGLHPSLRRIYWSEDFEFRTPQIVDLYFIILSYPNLTGFHFTGPSKLESWSLRQNVLTELTLNCAHFWESHYMRLEKYSLRLKSLHLTNVYPYCAENMRRLSSFLSSVSKTLVYLAIFGPDNPINYMPEKSHHSVSSFLRLPPALPHLRSLRTSLSVLNTAEVLRKDTKMPGLKFVELVPRRLFQWHRFLRNYKKAVKEPRGAHPYVQQLQLGPIDGASLEKIACHFTCVTILDVTGDYINDSAFRCISRAFRGLSHFRIRRACNVRKSLFFTDCGITGLDEDSLKKLSANGVYKGSKYSSSDGIIAFTRLSSFIFELVPGTLTDLSMEYGFARIAGLKRLELFETETGGYSKVLNYDGISEPDNESHSGPGYDCISGFGYLSNDCGISQWAVEHFNSENTSNT